MERQIAAVRPDAYQNEGFDAVGYPTALCRKSVVVRRKMGGLTQRLVWRGGHAVSSWESASRPVGWRSAGLEPVPAVVASLLRDTQLYQPHVMPPRACWGSFADLFVRSSKFRGTVNALDEVPPMVML